MFIASITSSRDRGKRQQSCHAQDLPSYCKIGPELTNNKPMKVNQVPLAVVGLTYGHSIDKSRALGTINVFSN